MQIKYPILSLFLLVQITIFAQSSSNIESYISKNKDIALEHERMYGIPASITLAQGILESGASKSIITVR